MSKYIYFTKLKHLIFKNGVSTWYLMSKIIITSTSTIDFH
jgi:hypothetical protein